MREIIALAMLVILGIGVAFAMGWYILIGHNWNIAAVHIDDYVGEMEGYTVIAYDGVLPKHEEIAMLVDVDEEEAAQLARRMAEGASPVQASQIADSYRDKNASVLLVNSEDPTVYSDPLILKCGSQRIGVFSVGGKYQYAKLKTNVACLKRHGVDKVIVVSRDRKLLDLAFDGADVAIFACDTPLNVNGEYAGRMFCVDCPSPREAKAVLVAPNNMMTAKTVEQL